MAKDYRAVFPELMTMNRKSLEKLYRSYASNINTRLRTIEKNPYLNSIISRYKNRISYYLTDIGRVSKSVKNKSTYDLIVGIKDLGTFLSLKATTPKGIKSLYEERRKFYEENEEHFSWFGTNISDAFIEFLESAYYKELSEKYDSDVILEELSKIPQNEKLTVKDIIDMFKKWDTEQGAINIEDIYGKMFDVKNRKT